jgi:phospholipid/cholesterol/gamma-HCH transport system substrate-binding protein
MASNLVESLIGALVLLVAGWFLLLAYERTDAMSGGGYSLVAKFDRIDGLNVGSDVRMSGIKVGTVTEQHLDSTTYQAVVQFSVSPGVELPLDTAAAISSASLLGGSYLSLLPGGEDEYLVEGDEIEETQDAVDLVGLIGKFTSGGDSSGKSE